MAITLDGTNGILSPDFEPSSSTTPTNGLFLPAANALGFATNSTERLRLDASGNLGLGVTSPGAQLDVATTTNLASKFSSTNANGAAAYFATGLGAGYIGSAKYVLNSGGALGDFCVGAGTNNNLIFSGNGLERARIDSSGNFIVGATGVRPSLGASLNQGNGTNQWELFVGNTSSANTSFGIEVYSNAVSAYRFQVGMGGTIYATSTSITAISDISLKENIRPLETGLAEVLALQPRRFDWKNGDGNNVAGFIAQEVETVLPDLVSDYKYNEEETKRGLKMGDMIPTLVKAIQELTAKVTALEAK